MHNTLQELLVQYQNQNSRDYSAARYPNPKVTSEKLIHLVASIKVAAAEARQLEIMNEIRKGEKTGKAFIVNDENLHLTNECENLKDEVALWRQYV
jgi:hypothetical protein